MSSEEKILQTQGLMVFLGALGNGLETLLGRGAESVCFRSGRTIGINWNVSAKESDLFKALTMVRQEMLRLDINWPFEIWAKQSQSEAVTQAEAMPEINLVFRNCIVRCTLFRYGFFQEMSLCQTKHGLFCGLLENISGIKTSLDVVHSGENACLLKLKYYD